MLFFNIGLHIILVGREGRVGYSTGCCMVGIYYSSPRRFNSKNGVVFGILLLLIVRPRTVAAIHAPENYAGMTSGNLIFISRSLNPVIPAP